MNTIQPSSYKRSLVSVRAVLLLGSLIALMAVAACSSDDEPESPVPPTAVVPAPAVTQVTPTAVPTVPPAPTATTVPAATQPPAPTPTQDPESALYTLELLATGQIDPNRFANVSPGESLLLDRAYDGAPPKVPHRADDLTITPSENSCMSCHKYGKTVNGGVAIQVPISHYMDYTTNTISGELYGMRYMCTACHVPQVIDEPPFLDK